MLVFQLVKTVHAPSKAALWQVASGKNAPSSSGFKLIPTSPLACKRTLHLILTQNTASTSHKQHHSLYIPRLVIGGRAGESAAIMADEMLARLDQLQRGARETHPRRQEYHARNGYGRYDAYETEPNYYNGEEMFGDENAYSSEMHGTQHCITLMI